MSDTTSITVPRTPWQQNPSDRWTRDLENNDNNKNSKTEFSAFWWHLKNENNKMCFHVIPIIQWVGDELLKISEMKLNNQQLYAAFTCSSDNPTSRGQKSFLWLRCVHVCQVAMWEQYRRNLAFYRAVCFRKTLTAVSGIWQGHVTVSPILLSSAIFQRNMTSTRELRFFSDFPICWICPVVFLIVAMPRKHTVTYCIL